MARPELRGRLQTRKILSDGAIELIIDLDTQPKSIFEDEASAVRVRSCDFVDRSDLSDKQNDPRSNTSKTIHEVTRSTTK
ncbi:MAG: hypothetical protein M3410_03785 [Acidobacteriota bacterium]|nr:hypothetical protein [Acidobacteriota bacterium]